MTGDPKQLLGGYATDSLTEEERQKLLRAALEDQTLFDTLLEEDGVRELLAAPLDEAWRRQEELGSALRRTEDAREAQRAFVEKRPLRFNRG